MMKFCGSTSVWAEKPKVDLFLRKLDREPNAGSCRVILWPLVLLPRKGEWGSGIRTELLCFMFVLVVVQQCQVLNICLGDRQWQTNTAGSWMADWEKRREKNIYVSQTAQSLTVKATTEAKARTRTKRWKCWCNNVKQIPDPSSGLVTISHAHQGSPISNTGCFYLLKSFSLINSLYGLKFGLWLYLQLFYSVKPLGNWHSSSFSPI